MRMICFVPLMIPFLSIMGCKPAGLVKSQTASARPDNGKGDTQPLKFIVPAEGKPCISLESRNLNSLLPYADGQNIVRPDQIGAAKTDQVVAVERVCTGEEERDAQAAITQVTNIAMQNRQTETNSFAIAPIVAGAYAVGCGVSYMLTKKALCEALKYQSATNASAAGIQGIVAAVMGTMAFPQTAAAMAAGANVSMAVNAAAAGNVAMAAVHTTGAIAGNAAAAGMAAKGITGLVAAKVCFAASLTVEAGASFKRIFDRNIEGVEWWERVANYCGN
jgi:hypothetical protein